MKVKCRFCGALIDSSSKLCPGCGRVAPAFRGSEEQELKQFGDTNASGLTPGAKNTPITASHASVREGRRMEAPNENYGKNAAPQQHADFDHIKAAQQQKTPFVTNSSSGKFENRSRVSSGVGIAIRVLIILLIAAIVYAAFKVITVKRAGYDFKLDDGMTLASSTYGEAVDSYFDGGKWRFDFLSNSVTYKGHNHHGELIEMTFGKLGDQVVVTELYVDGEMISGTTNIMNNYVLGMFMAEKGKVEGGTAFRRVGDNSIDI